MDRKNTTYVLLNGLLTTFVACERLVPKISWRMVSGFLSSMLPINISRQSHSKSFLNSHRGLSFNGSSLNLFSLSKDDSIEDRRLMTEACVVLGMI